MATKMRVQSAEKTYERVWNVTDDPRTKMGAAILMVMGKNIAPGMAVKVPLERLKGKRLKEMEKAKMVHVGPTLPQDYLVAMGRFHVRLPPTPNRHAESTERKRARAGRMVQLREKQAKRASADAQAKELGSIVEQNKVNAERKKAGKAKADDLQKAANARLEKAKVEIAKRTGGRTREVPPMVEKVKIEEAVEVVAVSKGYKGGGSKGKGKR